VQDFKTFLTNVSLNCIIISFHLLVNFLFQHSYESFLIRWISFKIVHSFRLTLRDFRKSH